MSRVWSFCLSSQGIKQMIPGAIDTGGGGLSNSSSAAASSGDAGGSSGTGNKTFTFGANPNATIATQQLTELLANPVVVVGAVLAIWLFTRKKGGF